MIVFVKRTPVLTFERDHIVSSIKMGKMYIINMPKILFGNYLVLLSCFFTHYSAVLIYLFIYILIMHLFGSKFGIICLLEPK